MLEDLDLSAIHEENARELIQRLLNLVEQLAADLREATIKGDYELMIAVIEAMGGYDPSVGDSLRGLAERFDYKRILEYLAKESTP